MGLAMTNRIAIVEAIVMGNGGIPLATLTNPIIDNGTGMGEIPPIAPTDNPLQFKAVFGGNNGPFPITHDRNTTSVQ